MLCLQDRELIIQGGVFSFILWQRLFLSPSRYFCLDVPLLKSSCLHGNWPPCAPRWLKETFRSSCSGLMIFTVSSDKGYYLIACSFQTHWRMVSHAPFSPMQKAPSYTLLELSSSMTQLSEDYSMTQFLIWNPEIAIPPLSSSIIPCRLLSPTVETAARVWRCSIALAMAHTCTLHGFRCSSANTQWENFFCFIVRMKHGKVIWEIWQKDPCTLCQKK